MNERISVDPAELRASAAAARNIGEELRQPAATATGASRSTGGELAGWSVGAGLQSLADGWAPTLDKLTERLASTAAALEASAQGHEWNDGRIADAWRKQGQR
ncbi:type VII secretion target [Kitasatospora sp. YST-16]|uniref:type VII secretion target n=1 Tax=Kitasatospora sp. YST-16 TaxID=2998080 RepID=UPI002284E009|nr:type VII secretion target [Kitasatospora sp. YST-16]WAL75378.1 type VII secretion target [Kitasatospora sp. YST-16]WNW41438.1 type VII secretion target [Streptomyces sp. Li-HN-5-13]